MVWVLWDILIPLMASFALGTLLGWLVWSWRRSNDQVRESTAIAEFADDSGHGNATRADNYQSLATESDSDSMVVPMVVHEQEAIAFKEMENANVVLITERDEATQAYESLQTEAEEMRDRIVELEADAEESAQADLSVNSSSELTDTLNDSLPLTVDLDLENKNEQELKLLRSDLQLLTDTLERERKARRATELELLNIKNRHDKLSSDFESTVSVDEHDTQINERDEEIVLLKAQLADQVLQLENDSDFESTVSVDEHDTQINERDEEIVFLKEQLADQAQQLENESALEEAIVQVEQVVENEIKQEVEVERELVSYEPVETPVEIEIDSNPQFDVAIAAGIDLPAVEAPVKPEASVVKNKKPNKNGLTPQGWTVPEKKPTKKERDNLTDIKGVGPVLEKILHDCGIYHFQQVADLDKNGMNELQSQIPQFPGRIKRDKWVKQAKALQRKKYGASA